MTDEEWIELLNNMEPVLLTACTAFDGWLLSNAPKDRIRYHLAHIKGYFCSIYLDLQELQWTGALLHDRSLVNPESLFVKEKRNEKSASS